MQTSKKKTGSAGDKFNVTMQRQHADAIVGALAFGHAFDSGDLNGTLGKAAVDGWLHLPAKAKGCYPARKGDEAGVRADVLKACDKIKSLVWPEGVKPVSFAESKFGRIAKKLKPEAKQDGCRVIQLGESDLLQVRSAVEFELRTRIGHLLPIQDRLLAVCTEPIGSDGWRWQREQIEAYLWHLKTIAWGLAANANYSPAFYRHTQRLYDIYQVIEQQFGSWRYTNVFPYLKDEPLMEIHPARFG